MLNLNIIYEFIAKRLLVSALTSLRTVEVSLVDENILIRISYQRQWFPFRKVVALLGKWSPRFKMHILYFAPLWKHTWASSIFRDSVLFLVFFPDGIIHFELTFNFALLSYITYSRHALALLVWYVRIIKFTFSLFSIIVKFKWNIPRDTVTILSYLYRTTCLKWFSCYRIKQLAGISTKKPNKH